MAAIKNRRERIKKSVRQKISGTSERPRLTVYRSNTGLYAQIVDDSKGITLAASSSKTEKLKGNNIEVATTIGKKIAENAKAAGIVDVVFDRNGYLYHGKIKAIADGAREGGLNF